MILLAGVVSLIVAQGTNLNRKDMWASYFKLALLYEKFLELKKMRPFFLVRSYFMLNERKYVHFFNIIKIYLNFMMFSLNEIKVHRIIWSPQFGHVWHLASIT